MADKEKQADLPGEDGVIPAGTGFDQEEECSAEGAANQDKATIAGDGEPLEEGERENILRLLEGEKARAEDYFNRMARMQADFDNYRKRTAREREDLLKYANEQLILSLLPVVDNFERALSTKNDDPEKLLAGVEMISRQLKEILEREGLCPIPAVGEQFNPEVHEAVMKEENSEYPENTIIEELQRGFTCRGKVIRAAMVKVAG